MPRQVQARPDPLSAADDVVVMGQVLAPYGIKGWLKIRAFGDAVDGLLQHPKWLVATRDRPGVWRAMRLAEGHAHGTVLVAGLEEIADRTQAEKLIGAQIAIDRKELPAPDAGAGSSSVRSRRTSIFLFLTSEKIVPRSSTRGLSWAFRAAFRSAWSVS